MSHSRLTGPGLGAIAAVSLAAAGTTLGMLALLFALASAGAAALYNVAWLVFGVAAHAQWRAGADVAAPRGAAAARGRGERGCGRASSRDRAYACRGARALAGVLRSVGIGSRNPS